MSAEVTSPGRLLCWLSRQPRKFTTEALSHGAYQKEQTLVVPHSQVGGMPQRLGDHTSVFCFPSEKAQIRISLCLGVSVVNSETLFLG